MAAEVILTIPPPSRDQVTAGLLDLRAGLLHWLLVSFKYVFCLFHFHK